VVSVVADPDQKVPGGGGGIDLIAGDTVTDNSFGGNIQVPDRSAAKAVAIKDASLAGNLPRVIASGRGSVAQQILQIAWSNNIKVREDADLVEVLSAIDVESEIPIEAFATVAEILSYVYKANAGEIPIEDAPDDATGGVHGNTEELADE
jgi:flagellar biosynthesis protein